MSDSTAQRDVGRRSDRHRHLGATPRSGSACAWCAYLDARGVWWLLVLTCLPQLAGRWSPSR